MSDETESKEPNKPRLCERCGLRMPPQKRGRPRRWCSQQCRQLAYEERHNLESWKDKQPKVKDLADVVEVMSERGAVRSLHARGFVTVAEHGHAPADCLQTIWNDRTLSAMVVDILSSNILEHGTQDTTEDRFLIWAITGLVNALRDVGLELDPTWGPLTSATERPMPNPQRS